MNCGNVIQSPSKKKECSYSFKCSFNLFIPGPTPKFLPSQNK